MLRENLDMEKIYEITGLQKEDSSHADTLSPD
jgi:hypothetical protein